MSACKAIFFLLNFCIILPNNKLARSLIVVFAAQVVSHYFGSELV